MASCSATSSHDPSGNPGRRTPNPLPSDLRQRSGKTLNRECAMPYTVDFNTVSTVGLEDASPRARERRLWARDLRSGRLFLRGAEDLAWQIGLYDVTGNALGQSASA